MYKIVTINSTDYEILNTYAVIRKCNSHQSTINVPKQVENKPVRKILGYAFSTCDGLEEIALPDSITYIGAYAFDHCKSLKRITLPSSLRHIGAYALGNCPQLEEIILEEREEIEIDASVFKNSNNAKIIYR